MNDLLIIISSKYPNSILVESVKCFRNIYPTEKIVIVDSNSSNFTHYETVYKDHENIEILMVKNKNYEIGAYKIGYNLYPNYKNYICVQDSVLLYKPLDLTIIGDNNAYTFFNDSGFYAHPSIKIRAINLLTNMKLVDYVDMIDTRFTLAQCNSYVLNNNTLKNIINTFNALPIDKDDACCHERFVGMYFIKNNINALDLYKNFTKTEIGRK